MAQLNMAARPSRWVSWRIGNMSITHGIMLVYGFRVSFCSLCSSGHSMLTQFPSVEEMAAEAAAMGSDEVCGRDF